MTQNEKVLRHLKAFGRITTRDAMIEYGIMRLGARIWDLRHKHGYTITKTMKHDLNRFGERCVYAEYKLVG